MSNALDGAEKQINKYIARKKFPCLHNRIWSILTIVKAQVWLGGDFLYYNKVEICGINTATLKTLKEKEKIELIIKAQAGDKLARDKLVQGNLRLVLSVVQKFTSRGANLDDLFQVGCVGLIKAIDRFDTTLDVRFSTYGVPMIIGEIRRFLRDDNMIRVSRSLRDTAYQALQAKESLVGEKNREPTVEEIAVKMGRSKEDVVLSMEAIMSPSSLYDPVYSDGRDTIFLMDQIKDKNTDSDWVDEIVLKQSLENLNDREKNILTRRFFQGKTQIEVSREIGISQAQVSRIEKGALDKIKKQL